MLLEEMKDLDGEASFESFEGHLRRQCTKKSRALWDRWA